MYRTTYCEVRRLADDSVVYRGSEASAVTMVKAIGTNEYSIRRVSKTDWTRIQEDALALFILSLVVYSIATVLGRLV